MRTPALPLGMVPGQLATARRIALARKYITQRIVGQQNALVGLEAQHKELGQFFVQISNGQSGSVVVSGPRGCGKSMLVSHALSLISSSIVIFRLDGSIHANTKLVIRSLGEQIAKHNDSHALANNDLEQVFSLVSSPIVLVLDELDLFVDLQSLLLHNLLELSNTRTIGIVGITTRWNVLEAMENRVRSRFSVCQIRVEIPNSFSLFQQIVTQALILPDDARLGTYSQEHNRAVEEAFGDGELLLELQKSFDTARNPRPWIQAAAYAMHLLSRNLPFFSAKMLLSGYRQQTQDPMVNVVAGLSMAEQRLLATIEDMETKEFTFQQVYEECFSKAAMGPEERLDREFAAQAYSSLASLNIIEYCTVSTQPLYFRPARLNIHPSIVSLALS